MKLAPKKREGTASATIVPSLGLILACCGLFALTVYASDPAWWNARGAVLTPQVATNNGVVVTNYIPNDYAAVTQGQLKQFTARAVDELNADLPNGAGTNLNSLVQGWIQDYVTNGYTASNLKPSDYDVMTVGQLKYVGNQVWTQLVAAGYTNAAPGWLAQNTNTDLDAANLGQLKEVFNFVWTGALGVSDLTATASPGEIDLSWTDPPEDTWTSLEVEQQNADGSWSPIAYLTPTATSYAATGLTTSQEYQALRVVVGTAAGGGVPSAPAPSPMDASGNGLSTAWEMSNFGATNVDPNADPDHDGLSNLQEYLAGTDPNNPRTAGNPLLDSQYASPTVQAMTALAAPEYQYAIIDLGAANGFIVGVNDSGEVLLQNGSDFISWQNGTFTDLGTNQCMGPLEDGTVYSTSPGTPLDFSSLPYYQSSPYPSYSGTSTQMSGGGTYSEQINLNFSYYDSIEPNFSYIPSSMTSSVPNVTAEDQAMYAQVLASIGNLPQGGNPQNEQFDSYSESFGVNRGSVNDNHTWTCVASQGAAAGDGWSTQLGSLDWSAYTFGTISTGSYTEYGSISGWTNLGIYVAPSIWTNSTGGGPTGQVLTPGEVNLQGAMTAMGVADVVNVVTGLTNSIPLAYVQTSAVGTPTPIPGMEMIGGMPAGNPGNGEGPYFVASASTSSTNSFLYCFNSGAPVSIGLKSLPANLYSLYEGFSDDGQYNWGAVSGRAISNDLVIPMCQQVWRNGYARATSDLCPGSTNNWTGLEVYLISPTNDLMAGDAIYSGSDPTVPPGDHAVLLLPYKLMNLADPYRGNSAIGTTNHNNQDTLIDLSSTTNSTDVNGIAWIAAHDPNNIDPTYGSGVPLPRMPELQASIAAPSGCQVLWKLQVTFHDRNGNPHRDFDTGDPNNSNSSPYLMTDPIVTPGSYTATTPDQVIVPNPANPTGRTDETSDGWKIVTDGTPWAIYQDADWTAAISAAGFFGGDAELSVKITSSDGNTTVLPEQDWYFRIAGENPDPTLCKTYLTSMYGGPSAAQVLGGSPHTWFAWAIAKDETQGEGSTGYYNHFLNSGILPSAPSLSPWPGRPNWHNDGTKTSGANTDRLTGTGGYGLYQLTYESRNTSSQTADANYIMPRNSIWSWQANAVAFGSDFQKNITAGQTLYNALNNTYSLTNGSIPPQDSFSALDAIIVTEYNGMYGGQMTKNNKVTLNGYTRPQHSCWQPYNSGWIFLQNVNEYEQNVNAIITGQ